MRRHEHRWVFEAHKEEAVSYSLLPPLFSKHVQSCARSASAFGAFIVLRAFLMLIRKLAHSAFYSMCFCFVEGNLKAASD
jgi:hypothetical protein